MLYSLHKKNKTILNALSAIICLFILFTFAYRYDKYRDFDVEYIKSAKELINRIPENELKNTYAYHTEAKIYLVTPLKPIYKYSFFQEWHAVNDPAILGDLNNYLRTENTHYVITQNSLMTGSYNLEAQKILRQDYDTIFSNEHLTLYKHINKR
ncbi:MAG: hypothetical protein ACLVKO_10190 [Dysgonomonas sp.]